MSIPKKKKLKKKRIFKTIVIGLVVIFLFAQVIPRPEKNIQVVENINHITNRYTLTPEVESVFKASCYDCHSNTTDYPWYASIQPVAWWLGDNIRDGKKELNFSNFLSYPAWKQFHKLEEVQEQVEEGEMPLESYTSIHRSAKINSEQKKALIAWTKSTRDSIKSYYPADSLIRPKRKTTTPS